MFKKVVYSVAGILLFAAAWEIISVTISDPAIVDITKIFKAFISIITEASFYNNLLSTVKIVFIGIVIAIIIGVTLAVFMDMFQPVRNIFNPLIEMFRNIPSIALFPILLVIYGIGDTARIFVIFWTAVPSIILSTTHGLRHVDKSVIEASKVDGANKSQIMRKIKFPLTIPEVLNGIKIGIGSGFVAIVVAEMLGASSGLGFMIMWSTNSFKYPETYAYIIIIALIGAIVNLIMSAVIKKIERKIL